MIYNASMIKTVLFFVAITAKAHVFKVKRIMDCEVASFFVGTAPDGENRGGVDSQFYRWQQGMSVVLVGLP